MSSCVDVGGHVFISFCKQMGTAISVFAKTCFSCFILTNKEEARTKKGSLKKGEIVVVCNSHGGVGSVEAWGL